MANKEMKTFTAGDVTYDIVDQSSRDRITILENKMGDGQQIQVDSVLSLNSSNPVQNKVITSKMNDKVDTSNILTLEEYQASTDLTGKIADAEATFKLTNTSLMINSVTAYRSGSILLSSSDRPYTFTSTDSIKYIFYQFTANISNKSNYFCTVYYFIKANTASKIVIPFIRTGRNELSSPIVFIPENVKLYALADGINDEIYFKAYLLHL